MTYLNSAARHKYPHCGEMVDAANDMLDNCLPIPPWVVRWHRAHKRWKEAFIAHSRQWAEEGLEPTDGMWKKRRWLARRGVNVNQRGGGAKS